MSTNAETLFNRPMTDFRCDEPGCTRSLLLSGREHPALHRLAEAAGWQVCDECVACPDHAPKPLPPPPIRRTP